jgi:uncharacterized protein YcbX
MADWGGAHAARRVSKADMNTSATVTELFVYPVKSTRGIGCPKVRITATGFEWDRQWMLIDARGTFLSQRTHPKMARIVPEIADGGLRLHADRLPPLCLPFTDAGERIAVRVHQDRCVGVDQGEEAAQWVSQALGEALRLVRVPLHTERLANAKFAGPNGAPMGFADGFPILVCNQASLVDLNRRMPAAIPMERFRPNIVLRGLPAWAEDHIDTLTVGELTLRLVKPCARCTIPSVDQRSGEFSTDPAPVLRKFRFDKTLPGITFGENAVIASGTGCVIERDSPCRVSFDGAVTAS